MLVCILFGVVSSAFFPNPYDYNVGGVVRGPGGRFFSGNQFRPQAFPYRYNFGNKFNGNAFAYNYQYISPDSGPFSNYWDNGFNRYCKLYDINNVQAIKINYFVYYSCL